MFDRPWLPQPIAPSVILFEGTGRSSAPSALAGIIVGNASAAPVVARNCLRLTFIFAAEELMMIASRFTPNMVCESSLFTEFTG